jgi:hypothetical protein
MQSSAVHDDHFGRDEFDESMDVSDDERAPQDQPAKEKKEGPVRVTKPRAPRPKLTVELLQVACELIPPSFMFFAHHL